jgi:hypothetical protein
MLLKCRIELFNIALFAYAKSAICTVDISEILEIDRFVEKGGKLKEYDIKKTLF